MRLVEGIAHVGPEADANDGRGFADVDAFVAELGDVGDEYGVTVQVFDAWYVVSRRHLDRALELADRERARGDGIARDRAVEVLLYAAGRRQIERALEIGVSEGSTPAVVLVDGGDGGDGGDDGTNGSNGETADVAAEAAAADAVRNLLEPAETLDDDDAERVREFFDVGDRELAATDATLEDLVLERVALLVVER
jgi:KEOPS complex subunit Cgi121